MKKGDFLWALALAAVVAFLVAPGTHALFVTASKGHPLLMAFVKFGLLATMGELLAIRIVSGSWSTPVGLPWKAVIWGFIGMLIALIFVLYDNGVSALMTKGYLPNPSGDGFSPAFTKAFFISSLMNLLFAPTFMAMHRVTDTWIDLAEGKLSGMMQLKLPEVLRPIDWNGFIQFVICRTIPLFWIPAHTIVFMLPSEYRVLVAAMLSIVLGAILGFAKKRGQTEPAKPVAHRA